MLCRCFPESRPVPNPRGALERLVTTEGAPCTPLPPEPRPLLLSKASNGHVVEAKKIFSWPMVAGEVCDGCFVPDLLVADTSRNAAPVITVC